MGVIPQRSRTFADLSLTRGRGQYRRTKEDIKDSDRIAAAARKAGRSLGMNGGDPESFKAAIASGATLISIAEDLGALNVGMRHAFDSVTWEVS